MGTTAKYTATNSAPARGVRRTEPPPSELSSVESLPDPARSVTHGAGGTGFSSCVGSSISCMRGTSTVLASQLAAEASPGGSPVASPTVQRQETPSLMPPTPLGPQESTSVGVVRSMASMSEVDSAVPDSELDDAEALELANRLKARAKLLESAMWR